jgi:hypothetical protein
MNQNLLIEVFKGAFIFWIKALSQIYAEKNKDKII